MRCGPGLTLPAPAAANPRGPPRAGPPLASTHTAVAVPLRRVEPVLQSGSAPPQPALPLHDNIVKTWLITAARRDAARQAAAAASPRSLPGVHAVRRDAVARYAVVAIVGSLTASTPPRRLAPRGAATPPRRHASRAFPPTCGSRRQNPKQPRNKHNFSKYDKTTQLYACVDHQQRRVSVTCKRIGDAPLLSRAEYGQWSALLLQALRRVISASVAGSVGSDPAAQPARLCPHRPPTGDPRARRRGAGVWGAGTPERRRGPGF